MTEEEFKSEMLKAKTFHELGERSDYWTGYMLGLRRNYHGDIFGTEEEHQKLLSLSSTGLDKSRRERGLGYRDGLDA